MIWRLGVDIGTNSLGWCCVTLDEDGRATAILAMGSRIFGDGRDPKSKQSLAIDRREARSARRRRDRFLQRQKALLKHLSLAGLFPPDTNPAARKALEGLDPFALRARALHEALTPHEIGRALFHLNQRRGFKSNRRADRQDDGETGKVRLGVSRLRERMDETGAQTFGAFLHGLRQSATDQNRIPSVRTRLRPETGENAKGDGYDFYPERVLLEEEFDAILDAQAQHHPALLTDTLRELLFDVIFRQRPLKKPEIGLCTLLHDTGERRLPKAHPLFQQRRLLEELNALRIVHVGANPEKLTREQRDLLLLKLKTKKSVKFESLRKTLKLDPAARFNKESENRTELKGDEVAAAFSDKKRFGDRWGLLSDDTQATLVERILAAETETDLAALRAFLEAEHRLTPEQAEAVADTPLPDGHGRFGLTATRRLITALRADVIVYSEAVEAAGLGHHSDRRTGEVLPDLPYYGAVLPHHVLPGSGDPADEDEPRFGKLSNPTVHIGLNQFRRVVNRLIKAYGPPAQMAIELARELKLTEEEKARLNKKNAENRRDAEQRSKKLAELGIDDKGANRARVKLWEELNRENALDRRCVYTGAIISAAMLFSPEVEIDHILPFSETLDDSQGNRLLCMRSANREKRKRSPWEAFGGTARWDEIAERATRLPREKRWRFEPDAMQRFDKDGGFLARHLIDTQHLSRLTREYASVLYPDRGEGSSKVWVTPGRLTEMLRRHWGLNGLLPDHNYGGGADQPKNRLDHRHHALDALVVAVTDRSMLQRIATASGRHGQGEADRLVGELPAPWEGFRDDAKRAVNAVVTSHRADRGTVGPQKRRPDRDATAGRLHNDTAFGLTGKRENGVELVVHRVPLTSLKPADLQDGGRRVADPFLRETLRAATAGTEGKAFVAALTEVARTHPAFSGLRRVRVVEPLSVIPIRDRQGQAYKGYKGDSNYRFDIWETKDGTWLPEIVSMFDVHQPGWESAIRSQHHNARKVLSLHRDDMVAIDRDAGRELMVVVKFSGTQLVLAPPNEAGSLKDRHDNKDDPFRYTFCSAASLKRWRTRQVRIDELGRVLDPGPRKPSSANPPAAP
ncbi:type II CRISPR RNA-guided endonuclease Cas9 [Acetobacteraceae bacterium KSS8]|uniref:CRISPR-associated endonuclease Cas9 n=1 Tax=Endosaccharibacter trunci TaxID=2812733 RepID=A0ABT1WCA0_9PROT|nr:type II CRISPR RNA-guided endonuclease Cas9 [Acetobacteraceae bacterium KSS8]